MIILWRNSFALNQPKKLQKFFFWFQISFCCATKRKQDFLLLQRKILSMSLRIFFSRRNHWIEQVNVNYNQQIRFFASFNIKTYSMVKQSQLEFWFSDYLYLAQSMLGTLGDCDWEKPNELNWHTHTMACGAPHKCKGMKELTDRLLG